MDLQWTLHALLWYLVFVLATVCLSLHADQESLWDVGFFLQKKKKLGITALEMLAIHCMTWPRGNKNYGDEYCQTNKIKPLLHEVVQSRQGLKLWWGQFIMVDYTNQIKVDLQPDKSRAKVLVYSWSCVHFKHSTTCNPYFCLHLTNPKMPFFSLYWVYWEALVKVK